MPGKWIKEFPSAITVCDRNGTLIEMNDRSCETFKKDGGSKLIGTNLSECHPGYARRIIENMLRQPRSNCYITEKKGQKKLVYQSPWFEKGEFMGLVEIAIELPENIPHHRQ